MSVELILWHAEVLYTSSGFNILSVDTDGNVCLTCQRYQEILGWSKTWIINAGFKLPEEASIISMPSFREAILEK